jgi:hypothetical protein
MGKAVTPQHHKNALSKGTTMTHPNFDSVPSTPFAPAPIRRRPFYKKKRFVFPSGVLLMGFVLGSFSIGC